MDVIQLEGAHGVTTLDAPECYECGLPKLRTEFYDSELRVERRRCRSCCRARIETANRRSGRRSMSMSLPETTWLSAVLRALPASQLSYFVRCPEYVSMMRKAVGMQARGTEAKRAGDAERETP